MATVLKVQFHLGPDPHNPELSPGQRPPLLAQLEPDESLTALGAPILQGCWEKLHSCMVSWGCLEEVDTPTELEEGWPGPQGKSPPAHGKQAQPAGAQTHLCPSLTLAGP